MDVAGLRTFVRNQTGMHDTTNLSNTVLESYLTISRNKIRRYIARKRPVLVDWDIFTANTVATQSEYDLQDATSTVEGAYDIFRIDLKWDNETETKYKKIAPGDSRSVEESLDYVDDSVSESNARWEWRNGSVFIYPAPSTSVTNGIKVYALHTLADLLTAGAESTIFPDVPELRDYHYIVGMGAMPFAMKHRKTLGEGEVQQAKIDFNNELENMVEEMARRSKPIIEGVLPSSRNLQE